MNSMNKLSTNKLTLPISLGVGVDWALWSFCT